ncbi:O-antigen ligase family protein [Parvibaculum sp.]|jgi:O-antigen ligase|uniref:O-antigen ligase family protein n=1 Tax=Parvibaculum sp. TaxID=2024848 RepID=UPI003919E4C1
MDGWQIDSGRRPSSEPERRGAATYLAEGLVVLVLLTSFYVKSDPAQDNPAPYDLLMAGTVALMFLFGLRLPRGLGWPAALWGLVVIGFVIGGFNAIYVDRVRPSLMTTVYLVGSFIFLVSWIYADPMRRITQAMWAYTAAATLAATAGVAGYFGLFPGSEIFTQYGRATGTFNDPNVFGPYLVAPILFLAMKLSQAGSWRALWMAVPFGLLVLAILLSFSRGAWGNLALAGLVFFGLTLATSQSAKQAMRLIGFGALAALIGLVVIMVALADPKVSALFAERASLTQSYDTDPEHGRFESQARAFQMVLEKPLGIGPSQWALINKLDTHNVYLHVLVAGGFLSGIAFVAFVIVTHVRAWRAIGRREPETGVLIVVFAAVAGHAAEALIIDIVTWRHFFLLLGILWGAVLAIEFRGRARQPIPRAVPRPAMFAPARADGFQI